jgi:tryptophanyl-tRNA synthetase
MRHSSATFPVILTGDRTTGPLHLGHYVGSLKGAVARLVGIEGGVVSGVINLESSGVEASDWRPRHDEPYHEV